MLCLQLSSSHFSLSYDFAKYPTVEYGTPVKKTTSTTTVLAQFRSALFYFGTTAQFPFFSLCPYKPFPAHEIPKRFKSIAPKKYFLIFLYVFHATSSISFSFMNLNDILDCALDNNDVLSMKLSKHKRTHCIFGRREKKVYRNVDEYVNVPSHVWFGERVEKTIDCMSFWCVRNAQFYRRHRIRFKT